MHLVLQLLDAMLWISRVRYEFGFWRVQEMNGQLQHQCLTWHHAIKNEFLQRGSNKVDKEEVDYELIFADIHVHVLSSVIKLTYG